jgi:hypothetical protein
MEVSSVTGETALLCPTDSVDAIELASTLWRKQLLPLGTIEYKGRRITFDKQYMTDLAAAFKSGAFDQVPFLLAKDDNKHTMDPERYRGQVKGVELTDKGLDVLLDLTPDAADLIRQNPKLGVSARIIEGITRADGATFPRAVQHVLGTLDPRVTGMESWEEVSLSEEVGDTIDMTKETVGVTTQPERAPSTQPLASDPKEEPVELSSDDLDKLASAIASQSDNEEIELVRAANEANLDRIRSLEVQLAEQRYVDEARRYIDEGVPPVLVELARPILCMPQAAVLDLSNDQSIDLQHLVRDMLDQTKGFLELARERGHSFDKNSPEDREQALLDAWKVV